MPKNRHSPTKVTPGRLFCFGLGYSALALAEQLKSEGWIVAGTCRTPERRAELERHGFRMHLFDRDVPLADPAMAFGDATHVLHSVPPDADGDPVLIRFGEALARLHGLRWFGYLSTTGVYGDRGGDWVDETSELRPSGERGRRRVAAEQDWQALRESRGLPVHIFRLAGIYGPGRSALDTVRSAGARRIIKSGQVFSRIHVDDIVQSLCASIMRPNPGAVYNLCDDDPAPPWDVLEFAAELLDLPPPPAIPFEQAKLSDMARSFYDDNKRVRNGRIKTELGVVLRYPGYRAGLRALLASSLR